MIMYNLVGYIILLPFIGFLINGLFGKKLNSEKLSGWLGSLSVGASFAIAIAIFFEMLGFPMLRIRLTNFRF